MKIVFKQEQEFCPVPVITNHLSKLLYIEHHNNESIKSTKEEVNRIDYR
jgi:hypothetical protein